jgi:hypothetical protein
MSINRMDLNNVDRERITDCLMKIQSVKNSLTHVTEGNFGRNLEILESLEMIDRRLRIALGYDHSDLDN